MLRAVSRAMLSVSVSDMSVCTHQPWIWMTTMTMIHLTEELLDLEALVQKLSKKGMDVATYAAIDDDTDACHCLDPADSDWRETLRVRLSKLRQKTTRQK